MFLIEAEAYAMALRTASSLLFGDEPTSSISLYVFDDMRISW